MTKTIKKKKKKKKKRKSFRVTENQKMKYGMYKSRITISYIY